MATYRKVGNAIRVETCVNGVRRSANKPTKREAKAWADAQEAEDDSKPIADHTFLEAIDRFDLEEADKAKHRRGAKWVRNKLATFRKFAIAKKRLRDITTDDLHTLFKQRRDRRQKNGDPISVHTFNREWNQLRAIFNICADQTQDGWKWLRSNPVKGIKKPKNPKGRCRRITEKEIKDICEVGFGYKRGKPTNQRQRIALMFQFCIETALRSEEATTLQRANCHATWIHIPKSKNGEARDVPLTLRAREILKLLPVELGTVFDVHDDSKVTEFGKARDKCGIKNLHFHDSRAEGIARLSKKMDVLELARTVGHNDINSLLHYYQTSAADIAARFG